MDIGCRFYTPVKISDGIAANAGKKELIVDLFSGTGNLYKAFFKKGFTSKALAFDINKSVFNHPDKENNVTKKVVDCLNPNEVKKEINGFDDISTAIILNPPFKRIPLKQELNYWKRFDGYQPLICTQRIECIAIATAINAAPKNSVIYVILPEIIMDSIQTAMFFQTLKIKYNMRLIKTYKRSRFGSAEVDVAVIKIKKATNKCITKVIKNQNFINAKIFYSFKQKVEFTDFKLFRGKVREISDRKSQISVKDLQVGGVDIAGNKTEADLQKKKENNYSAPGDILVARVGQRTIGRVGFITHNFALTNESLITLRIKDKKTREVVYDVLKSPLFNNWCHNSAKGTANYFIRNQDFGRFVLNIIKKVQVKPDE